MPIKYITFLVFFLISSSTSADSGCFDDHTPSLTPPTPGPWVLSSFYCRPKIVEWTDVFSVSPNRNSTASLHGRTLTISSLDGKSTISRFTGLSHVDGTSNGAPPLLKWSQDSQFVWTAEREVAKPSGFSLSGLRPLQIFATGEVKKLPPLDYPAGPLDKLLWINDKGLALAVFGIQGDYYRPEHADKNPTVAIVDARRGVVLDSFPILNVVHEVIQNTTFPDRPRIKNAAMTVLPDGRVRVLLSFLQFNEWVLWTQNEKPRLMQHPYMHLRDIQLTLSPDGEKLMVFQNLRTDGAMIEEEHFGGRGYIPGKSVSGLLASLYDLNTGKELWNILARIARDPSGKPPAPVISSDGRFALIRLPADTEAASIAMISMQDGKTLQRLPITGGVDAESFSMGFADQCVWTRTHNLTALYSFVYKQ